MNRKVNMHCNMRWQREAEKLYYPFRLHTFPGPNSSGIYEKKL